MVNHLASAQAISVGDHQTEKKNICTERRKLIIGNGKSSNTKKGKIFILVTP